MSEEFVDDRTDEQKIGEWIKHYRSLMNEYEEWERPYTKFDPTYYSSEDEYVLHQLQTIQKAELLDHLQVGEPTSAKTMEFGNKDELYAKACERSRRVTEAAIDKKIDDDVASAGGRQQYVHTVQTIEPIGATPQPSKSDLKLSDLLSLYVTSQIRGADWTEKTKEKVVQNFTLLIEIVGDKQVDCFAKSDVHTFCDALNERTTKRRDEQVRLTATTKNIYIASCKRVFEYAKDRLDGVDENLFDGNTVRFKANKNEKRTRNAFAQDELKRLFSQRVHTKGIFLHPYQYWNPLLALYTGMRGNELAQLHIDDVVWVDVDGEEVCCISLNLNTPHKRLKTGNEATLPLHPHLIELGFADFVNVVKEKPYRWKDEHGYSRLWRGLSFLEKSGYNKNQSHWFNGNAANKKKGRLSFKQAVGVESTGRVQRDFHSFRHTCATALENTDVPLHISYKITGHTLDSSIEKAYNSAGGGYRHGLEIKTMYDAICKLDFSDELAEVKPFFDVFDKKRLLPKVKTKPPKVKSK